MASSVILKLDFNYKRGTGVYRCPPHLHRNLDYQKLIENTIRAYARVESTWLIPKEGTRNKLCSAPGLALEENMNRLLLFTASVRLWKTGPTLVPGVLREREITLHSRLTYFAAVT